MGICTVDQLIEKLSYMSPNTMLRIKGDIEIMGNFNKGSDELMGKIVLGDYPFERADIELNDGYDFTDI
jgi:hypothetical protein